MSSCTNCCSVPSCKSRIRPLYRYPNPEKKPVLFEDWMSVVRNPRYVNLTPKEVYGRGYVCFQHFVEADFIPGHGTKRLFSTAVPSVNMGNAMEAQSMVTRRNSGSCSSSVVGIDVGPNDPKDNLISLDFSTCIDELCRDIETKLFPVAYQTDNETTYTEKRKREEDHEGGNPTKRRAFDCEGHMDMQPSTSASYPINDRFLPTNRETGSSRASSEKQKTTQRRSLMNKLGFSTTQKLTHNERKIYEEARRLRARVRRLTRSRNVLQAARTVTLRNRLHEMIETLTPVQQRFFKSQLRNVRRKPKGRDYTDEDKADAIALWKSGPRTYRLLSKMFALPSVSTLKATLNNVPIQPGISKPVFEVLKNRIGQKGSKKNKICTLLFDEVALQPHLDYSVPEDKVIGFEDDGWTNYDLAQSRSIADHACVFMLRGVYKRWKQPVAFAFCKSSMKAEDIVRMYKEVIKEATDAGLNVIASVCDQGTTNVKAIDVLLAEAKREIILKGGEERRNIIKLYGQNIIPLFDPPHLLKSLRNNLLRKELRYKDPNKDANGLRQWRKAKWSHVIEAYRLDQREDLRVMPKLSDEHVIPNKIKKMKVSLCTQVFSHSVAAGINSYAKRGSLPDDAYDTARFLKIMDDLFDSVNGGFGQTSGKPLRGKVFTKSKFHGEQWLKWREMFYEMEFIKSKPEDRARPPVLDGWYRTLDGFIMIKDTLRKLHCKSFPARAFNQDPLENFFGQIRQYGVRYTNPTCKAFLPFYKALLIRNFTSYQSKGANCERDTESLLATITDFVSQKRDQSPQTPEPVSMDHWQPPPVDDQAKVDTEVLGYIGGFLLHYTFREKGNECEICLRNLVHSGQPHDLHHRLVTLKEYGPEKQRLKYMNINIIKYLGVIFNHIKILLPYAVSRNHISLRIKRHLQQLKIDVDMEACDHSEDIKASLLYMFLKVYCFAYIKKLNRIAAGQQEPSDCQDQLQLEMQRLYKRFRK